MIENTKSLHLDYSLNLKEYKSKNESNLFKNIL